METKFKSIASLDPKIMSSVQLKLTYHGEQTKPILTVVMVCRDVKLNRDVFEPFRVAGLDYGNDLGHKRVVVVSPSEMQGVLQATYKMAHLAEENSVETCVSCTVVLIQGSERKGAYLLFDRDQAKQAVLAMTNALEPENAAGRDTLNGLRICL